MSEASALINNVQELAAAVAREQRDVDYFVLVRRRDVPGTWDLAISAPWANLDHQREALDYLVEKIKDLFGPQMLVQLARIVLLDDSDPYLRAYRRRIQSRGEKEGVYTIPTASIAA